MNRRKNYKNIIILIIIVLLFVMTTGYSIYQKKLDIVGITKIDYKDFNIQITNIETIDSSYGIDVISPSYTTTTAKFNSKITQVNGYIKYKVTVKNLGIIDGVLGAIKFEDTSNSVITYEVSNIEIDDTLKVNETVDIYVKATYDASKVDTATTNKSSMSVTLTFVQLEGYVNQNPYKGCFTFNQETATITDYSNTCPKDVVIPETIKGVTVKNIGASAFASKSLTSVEFPDTIETIGNYAFNNNKLTSLSLDGNIARIEMYAFAANKIVDISLKGNLKFIGDYAFRNNDIAILDIPSGVESIGYRTFYSNEINTLTLPDTLTSIGSAAFNDNELETKDAFIYKRNSDTSIDYTEIVSYGGKVKDVVIPDGVITLGDVSFDYNALTSISIPSSVKTIEEYAFRGNSLTNINIPSTVETIGICAFMTNYITDYTIPNDIIDISGCVLNDNKLEGDKAFFFARNEDGTDNTALLLSYGGTDRDNVVIPEGVEEIAEYGLYYSKITGVTLPTTLKTIGDRAFLSNQLTEITLNEGLQMIGSYAFQSNQLTEVTMPSTVITIATNSFAYNKIEEITLNEGLLNINGNAFLNNQLTTVTIPSTVKRIHDNAFGKNASSNPNLTTIINKTNTAFDWYYIILKKTQDPFITGTVETSYGNVTITS